MRRRITVALLVLGALVLSGHRGPDAKVPMQRITAVPETLTDDQLMWRARQFHGHLGPWLTLGIVMGEYAVDRLGGEKYTKLNVAVAVDPIPPQISIVDGLQLSTGCTMGNRNMTLTAPTRTRAPVRVAFVGSKGEGDTLTLEVLPQAQAQLIKWLRSGEDESALFKRIYHTPVNELFREVK